MEINTLEKVRPKLLNEINLPTSDPNKKEQGKTNFSLLLSYSR